MEKQKATSQKPWLIVGSLLILVMIGTAGCGSSGTSSQTTSQVQSTQGQTNQGQRQVHNPAVQAAMEIRRLQSNQQNALTTAQKDKIKPILQELINLSNPSQDVLQQKADAINAVLTSQQKSFLATAVKQRPSNGNTQNSNTQDSTNNTNSQGGANAQRTKGTFNPQDIYKQVLDLLK